MDDWKRKADQLKIPHARDWSLKSTLGNATTIQSWHANGLLQDSFTTDNAIILSTAKRSVCSQFIRVLDICSWFRINHCYKPSEPLTDDWNFGG